jgi:formate dehydrogenase (NADP+) beta subunit
LDIFRLTIDGRDVEATPGSTVLQTALDSGIYVPHLCRHPDLAAAGACRLCIVEISGVDGLPRSCVTEARHGMKVKTRSDRIDRMRLLAMELILSRHPADCSACSQYLNCELQSVKQYIGTSEQLSVRRLPKSFATDTVNPLFVHDPARCILCGRCVRACQDLRGVSVLTFMKKGGDLYVGTAFDQSLADSGCRFCGACVEVCPTGALRDKEELMRGKSRRAARVPCKYACPAEIDVPRYLRLIREKKTDAALSVIREKVPLPRILGYVCDHPCESACRRGQLNEPVSIRELKRFAVENAESTFKEQASRGSTSTGKRVAIIGSGPAGLTAGYYLSMLGHSVTVFEKLSYAGGMMRVGIPEYRLPRFVLDDEIASMAAAGVDIRTDVHVESLESLFGESFDAVLVAIGTHKGRNLPIPGVQFDGVLIGTHFLRDLNLGHPAKLGRLVVVLGGGNVAFDCARAARRLGAEARIACLESRERMLASPDEISEGEEEGIVVHPSQTFTRIMNDGSRITGVECLDVRSFDLDEDGRAQIDAVEGSEHVLEADTIIFAIGQSPDIPAEFNLSTGRGNLVEADPETLAAGREGVFAAGDAVSGTGSVIAAIASGRKAALSIDQFLGGNGFPDGEESAVEEPKAWLGPAKDFACRRRSGVPAVPVEERLRGFCGIPAGLNEESALKESERCLQCDLRLKIRAVKFWGDY